MVKMANNWTILLFDHSNRLINVSYLFIVDTAKILKTATIGNAIQQTTPTIKVGSTQIKPIINTSNAIAPQPVVISQPPIKSEPIDIHKSTAKDASAITTSSTSNANATTTPVSIAPMPVYPIQSDPIQTKFPLNWNWNWIWIWFWFCIQ